MNIIVAIRTIKIKKIIKPDRAPDLPNSKVVTNALGISATIPEKIISDIPFPIPLWVICSPIHQKYCSGNNCCYCRNFEEHTWIND